MDQAQLRGIYLLPTDSSYISEAQLELYDRQEIMLIRNEIYARYGCQFDDPEIQAYFDGQLWYTPVEGMNAVTFDTAFLNEYEQDNLQAIWGYERQMGWRE